MKTEPIRIESDRVQKVREHVANTKQTISGFIALAIDMLLKNPPAGYSERGAYWLGTPGPELVNFPKGSDKIPDHTELLSKVNAWQETFAKKPFDGGLAKVGERGPEIPDK